MNSGIYEIQNLISGKSYIGSAVNLDKRWGDHRSALRRRTHINKHLQSAYIKYGESAFKFIILEIILFPEGLITREQFYINKLKPEYNISPMAGSNLGIKYTKEVRRHMSEARKGKPSPRYKEHYPKMSEAKRGHIITEEARKIMSEAHKGQIVSEEARKKISEAEKGNKNYNYGKHLSEETKQKISEGNKGKILSEETKRKISKARKGKSNPHRGHSISEESKRKMSIVRKKYWEQRRSLNEKN